MGIDTLPVTVIQMGLVEKIAEVQQNQPYMQQLVAQDEAAAQMLREKSRIEETEKSQAGKKVRDKSEEDESRRRREERRSAAARGEVEDAAAGEEDARKADNPFSGHILNVKI